MSRQLLPYLYVRVKITFLIQVRSDDSGIELSARPAEDMHERYSQGKVGRYTRTNPRLEDLRAEINRGFGRPLSHGL